MLVARTIPQENIRRKSRRWVFTHNNYVDEDVPSINTWLQINTVYSVFGYEVGAEGTPHLQGFFILGGTGSRTLSWVRNNFPVAGVHFEIAVGSNEQAASYCKKEGNYVERGTFAEAGQRNDLKSAFEWGREFLREYGRAPTSPEILQSDHYATYVKHSRFRSSLLKLVPVTRRLEFESLRDWQSILHEELLGAADDRKIIFYVDYIGNSGKSFFCRYELQERPNEVQLFAAGKEGDLAYMVEEHKSVFLFDIARGRLEFLQYSILEGLKNGFVQSTKYASAMKHLNHCAHVVVFTNEDPDVGKLSEDRFDIRYI